MSTREDILKELQELAPDLAQLKREGKESGFQVPPTYFRDLTKVVMNEIQEERPDSARSLQTNWGTKLLQQLQVLLPLKPTLALASLGLLIAMGLWWSTPSNTGDTDSPGLALNNEELEAYVLANIETFETELLIDMYAETFSEEEEEPITEEHLDELLEEMNDEDFEKLWEAEPFKEEN